MKIFGFEFGKKGNNKSEKSSSKVSEDIPDQDDIIKDSLEVCYKPYSRYNNFVEQIKIEGWNYIGDVQSYSMTNHSNNIVSTYFVEKGIYSTFLDIMCPASYYKITICGFDDAGIDPHQFYSHPNLYKIPHFFSITCTDNHGKELSSDVTIDVTKVKLNGEPKKLCSELYGDISQHIDGRFRRKEERYYFYESIKLEDTDRLSFRTSPDIDIEKTKLFMRADLFAKDII